MERRGYFMSPKKSNKKDDLEIIVDENIYKNGKIAEKRTPLKIAPKLIMNTDIKNNDNTFNNAIKRYPSKSLVFSSQLNLNIIDKNNIYDEQYINMDEDNIPISYHWKYDGNTKLNEEKKHFPTKKNVGNFFKTPANNIKIEPINLKRSQYINNNDELYPNYNKLRRNYILYDNAKRNDINKDKDNISSYDLSNPNSHSRNNMLTSINNKNRNYMNTDINNLYPYDIPNNRKKYEDEQPPFINRFNINRSRNLIDINNYKTNDYKRSKNGKNNYHNNVQKSGNIIKSWEFPPFYYYNEGCYLPKKSVRYKNNFYI